MFCSACGAPAKEGSQYCSSGGSLLESTASPTVEASDEKATGSNMHRAPSYRVCRVALVTVISGAVSAAVAAMWAAHWPAALFDQGGNAFHDTALHLRGQGGRRADRPYAVVHGTVPTSASTSPVRHAHGWAAGQRGGRVRYCTKCGAPLGADSAYCASCAAKTATRVIKYRRAGSEQGSHRCRSGALASRCWL
jgi:hypothetical protein